MNSIRITKLIVSASLFFFLCAPSASGWCMTTDATNGFKTIPTSQWNLLISELKAQQEDLNRLQEISLKLSRPSTELQEALKEAQLQLQRSQTELMNARQSLSDASNDLAESRTSLTILRQQIDKERRVRRRQLWQNRFWFLLGGVAIGCTVKR